MNDLISRQQAIDVLIHKMKPHNKGDGTMWNVITKRPMDEEERKEFSKSLGYDIEDEEYVYSNLPDDGEEVIVCYSWGEVGIDTFRFEEGCYFEEQGDMDGVVAWMPLPEPYKSIKK